jgi:hypothetical protein
MKSRLFSPPAKSFFSQVKIMPSSSKPFVLFFNPVRHAKSFYKKFQDVAQTEVVTSKSREEFYKDIRGKYKDIFALYTTSASTAVSRDSAINNQHFLDI